MMLPNLIASAKKRLHSGVRVDPARDWFVLVAVSTVALAGIITWNNGTFGSPVGREAAETPITGEPAEFSLSSLSTIHAIFSNRASEETKYMTGKYRFTDPSQ